MENSNNTVILRGILLGRPAISHKTRNDTFYTFPLGVERLSGAVDTINIVAREALMKEVEISEKDYVQVCGELRSFNNKSGTGNRLVITVFARELGLSDGEPINIINLNGTLCKPPVLRSTPMGREICDLMVAVNRRYGRSDYLPCIVWGQLAQRISQYGVGTQVSLTGRVQSRNYIKVENNVSTEKTAFEVSVVDISVEGGEE